MNTKEQTPDAEVMDILTSAFRKYEKGEEKHGVIDLDNDPRDFLEEAEDELLDAIVYMAFEISKLRRIRARRDERSRPPRRRADDPSDWTRYNPKEKERVALREAETCHECGEVYLSLYPLKRCGEHEGLERV